MKQVVLLLVCTALSVACFSQTKRIAHRSHSGSNHSFNLAGEGNFGLPSKDYMDKMRAKDSIAGLKKNGKDSLKTKTGAKDSLKKQSIDSIKVVPSQPDAALMLLLDFTESLVTRVRQMGFHS
jgi:hypothetical protein